MKIIKQNQKAVEIAVDALAQGKLVFMATETVYIAAVDATNPQAVKKLIAFKNRPFGKPFSVGVTDIEMAEKYVDLNDSARKLYDQFLPGPVTVVSNGKHTVAPGVEAENGTLGIRIPDYKFVTDVVRNFGKPITTTSANASYQRRPYKLDDILDNSSEKQKKLIDLMIDAGELPHNEPSTVIDTTLDNPTVLRQGEIKLKDKNEVLSRSEENTQNIGKELWQKYESFAGKRPLIFALEGEMGAGKTQFTKGLARAMGITETVTSPTFSLVEEYQAPHSAFQLQHFDAWRLTDSTEMEALGFLKMVEDKNMVISIEWAERVADIIKKYRDQAVVVWVKIEYPTTVSGQANENERLISWGNL
ncbi:MAG TPA: L-threonylcarbamoyladenylate synthase [Alphaproteobacteria bacterium]|nr:L-threonylcarbamoyladenylate synthase [Alphaproteobacteria bacterium]